MSYPEESLYWKGRGMDSSQSEPVVSSNGQGEAAGTDPLLTELLAALESCRRDQWWSDHLLGLGMERISVFRPSPAQELRLSRAYDAVIAALKPSSGATAPRTATTAD